MRALICVSALNSKRSLDYMAIPSVPDTMAWPGSIGPIHTSSAPFEIFRGTTSGRAPCPADTMDYIIDLRHKYIPVQSLGSDTVTKLCCIQTFDAKKLVLQSTKLIDARASAKELPRGECIPA